LTRLLHHQATLPNLVNHQVVVAKVSKLDTHGGDPDSGGDGDIEVCPIALLTQEELRLTKRALTAKTELGAWQWAGPFGEAP